MDGWSGRVAEELGAALVAVAEREVVAGSVDDLDRRIAQRPGVLTVADAVLCSPGECDIGSGGACRLQ